MTSTKFCKAQINTLWDEVKRFENPHRYYVDLSRSFGIPEAHCSKAVEVKNLRLPLGGKLPPERLMRGRLANTVRLRVAAETQPSSVCGQGRDTPKGGRHFFPKTSTILTKRLQPAPLHILWSHSLCGGIMYVEQLSLFFWAAGPMLRSSWRLGGTTHWTMFAAGGACLCLFAKAGCCRCRWPGPRPGAAGVSGLELAGGAVCRSLLHTEVWGLYRRVGGMWSAYLPAVLLLLVFALRVGHLCAAGRESTVYHPQNSLSDS